MFGCESTALDRNAAPNREAVDVEAQLRGFRAMVGPDEPFPDPALEALRLTAVWANGLPGHHS